MPDEMFTVLEKDYNDEVLNLKMQLNAPEKNNPNFYEDGRKILELSNSLHRLYVKANYQEKAHLLKIVASNYILHDVSVSPK
jgi:hypothetical protein